MYSSVLMDHFRHPRNVGLLDADSDNVGSASVGSVEEGMALQLQIAVDDNGFIQSARYKVYGCAAAIAAGSLATEWIIGKTLEDAIAFQPGHIRQALNLPPVKVHCSILTEDAVKAAVSDYKRKQE